MRYDVHDGTAGEAGAQGSQASTAFPQIMTIVFFSAYLTCFRNAFWASERVTAVLHADDELLYGAGIQSLTWARRWRHDAFDNENVLDCGHTFTTLFHFHILGPRPTSSSVKV